MTSVKAYLEQIGQFNRLIENKKYELEELEAEKTKINQTFGTERVVTSPSDVFGNTMVRIYEQQKEIIDFINSLEKKKKVIIGQIDNLAYSKPKFYSVLTYKYVREMTYKEIAVKMNLTESGVNKLLSVALKEFEARYGAVWDIK